ncbi:hypothetical protein SAMN05216229_12364 [Geopseudomonas sagittaria]|uniref:Uncharacterized protein n=1 Tax=Geopseudomonas sagittaria TaxID=1135990 RepID=A0A1I5YRE3_9GAMM|nr:hypothetical protein [Pseudomonas sagittaria]SFQ46854.1 hypothetical protein SAMN05216229_12364 [Pseudomonas sagittaria]
MKPLHGDAEHWFGECAKLIAERDALATDWRVASGAAIMLRTELADMRSERDALAQRCRELEAENNTFNAERLRVGKENATLRAENIKLAEWYSEAGVREDTLRAEVADLKARLLEAERGNEELVRLRAENRELEKDTARIDWLADQFKTCTVYMTGEHPWRPTSYKLRELNGPTFRHAIDAAMGEATCATTDGATATP